jgi:hypothetical protein
LELEPNRIRAGLPQIENSLIYANAKIGLPVLVTGVLMLWCVNFEVDLLEYCDETGRFHYNQWCLEDAPIYRSLLSDHRNKDGTIGFVSLIVDAIKR